MKLYRAENLLDLETVKKSTIAFLGFGSLGSLTASLLAYPWGRIILIDPEKLEADNVERHLLGYSQVGKPKVQGGREWLIDRGVEAKRVLAIASDASKETDALAQASILVVSIDDPESCYKINQLSVNQGIPAVYGGIYPMGTGGQTVILPRPEEECYLCSEKKMGALDYKGKLPTASYGVDPTTLVNSAGKVTAVPALKYSIGAVASDMAAAVMAILSGTAEPEILIHAQTWEGIINVRQGENLNRLAGFITSLSDLGLTSNIRLTQNGGGYQLNIRKGKLGLRLNRWDVCPAHSSVVSIDQI